MRILHAFRRMFAQGVAIAAATILVATGELADAQAQDAPTGPLRVDITQGHLDPMPIAILDFLGANTTAVSAGRDIAGVIRSDLERSALFRPIAPAAFIERISDINVPPRFADWRVLQAQAIVVGEATTLPDGRLRVQYRLWDALGQRHIKGQAFASTQDNWRRLAHKVADDIYE